jgi:hypothetical protein
MEFTERIALWWVIMTNPSFLLAVWEARRVLKRQKKFIAAWKSRNAALRRELPRLSVHARN